MSPRLRAGLWPALLALLVAVAGALVAHYALRYHLRQNDEGATVSAALRLSGDLGAFLQSAGFPRGPERLTPLALSFVDRATSSTVAFFEVSHLLLALVWALIAVPVFGAARLAGVPRWGALPAAALVVLGPGAVFGLPLLNTTIGTLGLATLLWATLRTALERTWWTDLAVLGAGAVMVGGRVGYALLLLVPYVVVTAVALGDADGPWRSRLGAACRRLVREHAVLLGAAALVLLAVLLLGRARVLGPSYDAAFADGLDLGALGERVKLVAGRGSLSLLLLPALLAWPWIAWTLVRPADRQARALAVLCATVLAVLVVSLLNAPVEGRYLLPATLVLALAAARAVACAEVQPVGIAITAVVLVVLLRASGVVYPTDEPFSAYLDPGSLFYRRVVLGRLSELASLEGLAATLVVVGVLTAVALALAFRARLPGRAATALTAGVAAGTVLVLVAAGAYAMDRFTDQAARSFATSEQMSFVDEALGQDGEALLVPNAGPPDVDLAQQLAYFNRAVTGAVALEGLAAGTGLAETAVTLDRRTGALGGAALPDHLVVPLGLTAVGFDAEPVVVSPPFAMTLVRLRSKAHAAFVTGRGIGADGLLAAGGPVQIRTFPRGPGRCLTGTFAGADLAEAPVELTLRTGSERTTISAPARVPTAFRLPLPDRPRATVSLDGGTPAQMDDLRVTPGRLAGLAVGPC